MKRRRSATRKKKQKKRGRFGTVVLVIVFLVGIGILLYPSISNWWNERVTTRAVAVYDEAVAAMDEADYSAYWEAAEAYNEKLVEIGSSSAISNTDLVDEDYWNLLDITGTGIMGYITIDKINVALPIYDRESQRHHLLWRGGLHHGDSCDL